MGICINCGCDIKHGLLCPVCADNADIRQVCEELIRFNPDPEKCTNTVLLKVSKQFEDPWAVRDLIYQMSDYMDRSLHLYYCLRRKLSAGKLKKADNNWLYENYEAMMKSDLSDDEKAVVERAMFVARWFDHNYNEAESHFGRLVESEWLDAYSYSYVSEYLMNTRRYSEAEELLAEAKEKYQLRAPKYDELLEKAKSRQNGKTKEYMPKEECDRISYVRFMNDVLDVDVTLPVKGEKKRRDRIDAADYPPLQVINKASFRTFVAYDVETTGLSSRFDCITEIGAVKVVDGKVKETQEFTFQTLIHPYGKKIPQEIELLTGISNGMLTDAPDVADAFNAFADFISDDILIGFNNVRFDNKFIIRAGRYAKRIITNQTFDVMTYLSGFSDKVNGKSLSDAATSLNIKNPQAHRALSDAITTAKVYLALLDMDNNR